MNDREKARLEFWSEFTSKIRIMHFISDITEKNRTTTQIRQLQEARDYVLTNFDKGARMMGEHLFSEMQIQLDEEAPGKFSWLHELIADDNLTSPKFPSVFTPIVVQELIVKIYGAQTTIASTLEEIEPAYRKWLDYENRVKLIYKAACGLDKEWQTDALFMTAYPEDIFVLIRRLGEFVGQFKLRLEQLTRAYEALSRIITVMEMNPTSMMTRKEEQETTVKKHSFGGSRGFGKR
jgi:hypothetical protein